MPKFVQDVFSVYGSWKNGVKKYALRFNLFFSKGRMELQPILYYCNECETQFTNKRDFDKHERVPDNFADYFCCVCRERTKYKNKKSHNNSATHKSKKRKLIYGSQEPNPQVINVNVIVDQNLTNEDAMPIDLNEDAMPIDLSENSSTTDTGSTSIPVTTNPPAPEYAPGTLETNELHYSTVDISVIDDEEAWARAILDRNLEKLKDYKPNNIKSKEPVKAQASLNTSNKVLLSFMAAEKPSKTCMERLIAYLKNCKDFKTSEIAPSYKQLISCCKENVKTSTFQSATSNGKKYYYRSVLPAIELLLSKYYDKMIWEYQENNGVIEGPMSEGVSKEERRAGKSIES